MRNPFTVRVWDGAFAHPRPIGNPASLTVHPRHNAQPTAELTVMRGHQYAAQLLAAGARLTIDYDGEQILSGPVRLRAGNLEPAGLLTFAVDDDWRILTRLLGWPNPTGGIAQQGDDASYDTHTGPAETVLKRVVARNATRVGIPLTIAPDQGRGQVITVALRMHRLVDRLLPAIDQAGIGVTVRQAGAGLVLDCYTPRLHPRTLTLASGAVTDLQWTTSAPAATRTVIGGGGEGTDRDFRQVINAPLEAQWADVVEVFADARDAKSDASAAATALASGTTARDEKQAALVTATTALDAALSRRGLAAQALSQADYTLSRNPGDADAQASREQAVSNDQAAATDLTEARAAAATAQTEVGTAQAALPGLQQALTTALATYEADLASRAALTLQAGAPTAGLKLTLAETTTLRYGRTVRVGDRVAAEIVAGADLVQDVLREAVLSYSPDAGVVVQPVVGDRTDDPVLNLASAIAAMGKAIRHMTAGS